MTRWHFRPARQRCPQPILLVSALTLLLAAAPAAPHTWPAPETRVAPPRITKRDLAVGYLRLEAALRQFARTDDELVRINQDFDHASMRLLAGDAAAALREFDQLTASLRPEPTTPFDQWLLSLRVRIHPPVATRSAGGPLRAAVAMLYPSERADLSDDAAAALHVVDASGKTVATASFTVGEIGEATTMGVHAETMPAPGRYRVVLKGDGAPIDAGFWQVVETPMNSARGANEQRLEAIARAQPELLAAVAICRARNALLSDAPPVGEAVSMITNQHTLHGAVAEEIAMLESGRDPYVQRRGDLWRTIHTPTGDIPFRLYVPETASAGGGSLPLVIALHGAGADENMFFEGYGLGELKRLADEHGFIAATPLVYSFGQEAFEALRADLSARYAIDENRVYVLGHSLGGGAAWALGMLCHEHVAAAACIAGVGAAAGDAARPPTLVLAGELDPIISSDLLRQAAERTAAKGAPVEFRVKKSYGHTLLVNDFLAEVIEWLLQHTGTGEAN